MRIDRNIVIKDFMDALERLKEALERPQTSAPTNIELRKLHDAGDLVINISTVAIEAGRSRRLIASKHNCAYPEVREAVLNAQGKTDEATPRKTPLALDVIQRLRDEKKVLLRQNRLLATRVVQATLIAQRVLERLGVEERGNPMAEFKALVAPKRATGRRRR